MSEWREVWSDVVSALSHDPQTGELQVRWKNGRVSVYEGVTAAHADEIARAPSVGAALYPLRQTHRHRYGG